MMLLLEVERWPGSFGEDSGVVLMCSQGHRDPILATAGRLVLPWTAIAPVADPPLVGRVLPDPDADLGLHRLLDG